MLIQSLTMVDFRQFKGKVTINFSCDKKRNVTVILGDNTFGKTTLLQAFNWCLYNKVNLPHNDRLLNLEVAKELPPNINRDVSVQIVFIYKGVPYTVTRTQTYCKINNSIRKLGSTVTMSYLSSNGITNPIKSYQIPNIIRDILPEELSSYFFFDTERVNSVSERRDLATAVKGLLGLTVLENACNHLGAKDKKNSVIGQLYKDLAGYSSDSYVQKAIAIIDDDAKKRESCQRRIRANEEQIAKLKQEVDKISDILAAFEDTRRLQEERKKLEKELSSEKSMLTLDKETLRKQISHRFIDFFCEPLVDSAMNLLKETKIIDKGIKGLTAPTLKVLLQRGVCVCGRKLDAGSEAYQHVLDEIAYVPPASIGTTVASYKDDLQQHKKSDHDLVPIQDGYKKIALHEDRIGDWEARLDEISKKVSGQEDMEEYEIRRNRAKAQIESLNQDNKTQNRADAQLEKEILDNQKYIDSHEDDSAQSAKLRTEIAYAEAVLSLIQESYSKREQEIRNQLSQKVNEVFDKMYTDERKVVIDDKYHVQLLSDVDGEYVESGESEGLLRVKNFAFIAGLVALAKERIVARAGEQEIDLSSEPYPLVMDAPFSNADEHHTANISMVLPEVAEQVIMFVMQKDWNYAEKVMNDKVGTKYQLHKINEVHTTLEVVQNV